MNEEVIIEETEDGDFIPVQRLAVRHATQDDRAEIVGLLGIEFASFTVDHALHPAPGIESAVEYYERMVAPSLGVDAVFVAYDEDSPDDLVGWARWIPARTPTATLYRSVIAKTFVRDEFRRQGVGTALRLAAAKHCVEQGYEVLVANVEVGNKEQLNTLPGINPLASTISIQVRLSEITGEVSQNSN